MNKLTDIAQSILSELDGHCPKSSDFPGIVCQILSALPPIELHDAVEYVESMINGDFEGLRSPNNQFGQPNLTLAKSDEVLVELIHWPSQLTAVHCHNFQGGFKVLQGARLHLVYNWQKSDSTECGLEYGKLSIVDRQLLQEASVHPIKHHEDFIHCLAGVTCPSLTLVVRNTNQVSPKSYFPPCIALNDDERSQTLSEKITQFENLKKLSSERALMRLQEWIKGASPADVFVLCMRIGVDPAPSVLNANKAISSIPGLAESMIKSIGFERNLLTTQSMLSTTREPSARAECLKKLFGFASTV